MLKGEFVSCRIQHQQSYHIQKSLEVHTTQIAALSRCVGTFQSGGVSSAWTMSFSLCHLNELFRAAISLKYGVRVHIFYNFLLLLHLRVPLSVSVHPEGQGLVSSFSCMHQLMDEPPSSVCLWESPECTGQEQELLHSILGICQRRSQTCP